jgi:hypothetical protein
VHSGVLVCSGPASTHAFVQCAHILVQCAHSGTNGFFYSPYGFVPGLNEAAGPVFFSSVSNVPPGATAMYKPSLACSCQVDVPVNSPV